MEYAVKVVVSKEIVQELASRQENMSHLQKIVSNHETLDDAQIILAENSANAIEKANDQLNTLGKMAMQSLFQKIAAPNGAINITLNATIS